MGRTGLKGQYMYINIRTILVVQMFHVEHYRKMFAYPPDWTR